MTRWALLLGWIAIHAVGQQPAPGPSGPPRAYLRSCERFGFSGSVLVAKGGKILLAEGFGLADREKKTPNTQGTLFEIASATKSFAAVAILQLEVEARLSCDDPIGRHLPGVPPGFETVTIRHLLTHTSGMPRSAGGGSGDDLAKAVSAYLSPKPARPPGTTYEYWNGGYALLAGVVERVSGMTFMEFVRHRIFEPAGMKSSGFTGDTLDPERVATGYEGDGSEPRRATDHPYNGTYGWHYRGMGGLVTSVEDLYRFDRALRDDTLLPARSRTKLFTPFLGSYACGFEVVDEPRRRVGHGGSVRGFHCQFSRYPGDDACIVVLQNGRIIPPFVVEETLRALVFGGPSRFPKPPETVAWTDDAMDALAGTYEAASGDRVVVRAERGTIVLGAEGPAIMRELATAAVGSAPHPADPALVQVARTIVERLAAGDVAPLRERLAPGIPARWPDDVRERIWPARVSESGKLLSVRLLGSVATGRSTTVLLGLDFEKGPVRLKISFAGDRLKLFDLQGPEFLVEAIAAPAPDGRLLRFHWQGPPASPIAIERGASGNPTALRFEGPGTQSIYKRLSTR